MFAEADARLEKMFAESKPKSNNELEEIKKIIKANAKQIGSIDRSNGMMSEETIYNALKKFW